MGKLGDKNFTIDSNRIVRKADIEVTAEVPYEHNTLVVFLNTIESFHGVSVRKKTKDLRYSFDICFEVKDFLFDIKPHTYYDLWTRTKMKVRHMLPK